MVVEAHTEVEAPMEGEEVVMAAAEDTAVEVVALMGTL